MGSSEKKSLGSTKSKKRDKSGKSKKREKSSRDADPISPPFEEEHEDEALDGETPVPVAQLEARDALAAVSALLRDDRIQGALYDAKLTLAALQEGQIEEDDHGEQRRLAYRERVRAIREAVRTAIPGDATLIVATSGDDDLLDLYGREAWHFPQRADGAHASTYPADGTGLIAHLETLRARGASFFLVPKTEPRWLGSYRKFMRHLEQRYPVVLDDEGTCLIFRLEEMADPDATPWLVRLTELISDYREHRDLTPAILDWDTGLDIEHLLPGDFVFSPPSAAEALPYLDRSIPIVAVCSADPFTLREARRVAEYAVVRLAPLEATGLHGDFRGWEADMSMDVSPVGSHSAETEPTTSIVIPTYNGSEQLDLCLRALRETLPDPFAGEVIVVDDGSGEEIEALLDRWRSSRLSLEVVRNSANCGFVVSCNRGAEAATGDILVFLNDDTLPQRGWLPPLLRIFRRYPDAGAVGGRVLCPDGTLQEAGSLIFSDGSAADFGRGDYDPDAPIYCYVREVDYCTAALLATPRALFAESGGFDERYRPAYYEDTDYCFGLRRRGYRTYYQPDTVVVHTEGATAGTDLSRGVKRYQAVNHVKFARKWGDALDRQPPRPAQFDLRTWHALAAHHVEA